MNGYVVDEEVEPCWIMPTLKHIGCSMKTGTFSMSWLRDCWNTAWSFELAELFANVRSISPARPGYSARSSGVGYSPVDMPAGTATDNMTHPASSAQQPSSQKSNPAHTEDTVPYDDGAPSSRGDQE